MDYIGDKLKQANETIQGATSQAKVKDDKEVIKGDAPAGTKVSAFGNLVGDKTEQKSHENKAKVHDAKSEAR